MSHDIRRVAIDPEPPATAVFAPALDPLGDGAGASNAPPYAPAPPAPSSARAAARAIESDAFPFEFLSILAERESWRKEVHRPIYHVHKWWAKRLGSVFRGLVLGSVLPAGTDVRRAFYDGHTLARWRVFDPFMGSGTTVGEAVKLGLTALGRDINPVACEAVRVALAPLDARRLTAIYHEIEATVGRAILDLYTAADDVGRPCEVLYYFWVKRLACPACTALVDLRTSYVFARNAYPGRKPEVQVACPGCGGIFTSRYGQRTVTCPSCALHFNPDVGPVRGQQAACTACHTTFPIGATVRASGVPPAHRLYAKLVWTVDDEKRYLPATADDRDAYEACAHTLAEEEAAGTLSLPVAMLMDGYNTRQALSYNYRAWRDFFNARQLLALGWLHRAIVGLPASAERDALRLLFSGVLEFNNLFASYKGEGTGAVRHMFAHHVLKPERTPLEANVWGTPRSSGAFSGLFRSRLMRALQYRGRPYELNDGCHAAGVNGKVYGISHPIGTRPLAPWPVDGAFVEGAAALSCGSSDATDLPAASIDVVVTDPPFFDNVHYSELADFFYAWQAMPAGGEERLAGAPLASTRHPGEVQDGDRSAFTRKLTAVWRECRRVLRDDGLLVFTYHHARTEGWAAVAQALAGAGFEVVQAHPVRSEMAGATPKHRAKQPILFDAVLVCRKAAAAVVVDAPHVAPDALLPEMLRAAFTRAAAQVARLVAAGFPVSLGDAQVLLSAQLLVHCTGAPDQAAELIEAGEREVHNLAARLVTTGASRPQTTKAAAAQHTLRM